MTLGNAQLLDIEQHEAYWVQRLQSLVPLAAPFQRRSAAPCERQPPALHRWSFTPAVNAWLQRHAAHTPAALITAAFGAFLARASGQHLLEIEYRDAAIAEAAQGIENSAAHLPLRFNVDVAEPFAALLHNTQAAIEDAHHHRGYRRDLAERHPVLQEKSQPLHPCPIAVETADALAAAPPSDGSCATGHELTLIIAPQDAWLAYDPSLFASETIAAVAAQFDIFLNSLCDDETRALQYVSMVTAAERDRLLVQWNQTAADYPRDACVHQLFEAQVQRTPQAVAVACGDARLTFSQLNEKANQLAHYLKKRGAGPEVLVGLCMRRSLEMMIGLLGILKAGAAYVPLDPAYPRDRLSYMLNDARAPVLVTEESLRGVIPDSGAEMICVDAQWPSIARESTTNPAPAAAAGNLVYVIYTSGSTGLPKGTMIEHRALVNYLAWAVRAYHVAEGGGAPVHSSISFDLTITGLFAPLLAGRTVFIVPEDRESLGLMEALQRGRDFSLVKITPAHLELLAQQMTPEDVAGRTRWFIIGGENLTWESIRFWQEHAPETVLINEYGPTETVVGCCVYQAPRDARRSGSVPIGRPIANTQLYLLDSAMQLVPIGAAGELYIGGDGVARGYLHQPEATAASFLPDPFSAHPGARMYRTGDLARYLPDGNLEFLGRIDQQVKIRGYRIELGEIESAIRRFERVRECAVVVRNEPGGDRRLVAYVIPHRNATIQAAELRAFLKQWLPAYMLPAAIVFMEAFALSPNGKVDRRRLPEPGGVALSDAPRVAPRTALEESIAAAWCRFLGLREIGVTDNFFDLGGHSLLAVRVINELNRTLEIPLNVLRLYQNPTVERLAAAIATPSPAGGAGAGGVRSTLIPLQPPTDGDVQAPIYFIYAGPEEFRVAQALRDAGIMRAMYAIEAPWSMAWRRAVENNDIAGFPTMEELSAPFAAQLIAHVGNGPCVLAGYSFAGLIGFEAAHQLIRQGGTVERMLLLDSVARYPTPRQQWLHNWRLDWEETPSILALNRLPEVAVARTRSLWRLSRWTLQNSQRKMMSMIRTPQTNPVPPVMDPGVLTSLRDEQGGALHWGLVERLYAKARYCYSLRPLDCRGALFTARNQGATPRRPWDETQGWRGQFNGGLRIVPVPGTHHSVIQPPELGELCTRVNAELSEAAMATR